MKPLTAALGAAAAGLVAGAAAYASNWPTSQLFGRTLIAGSDPNELALTYDDGPNPTATPRLLETLAKHNVRATFFIIGDFARKEPNLLREVAAAGHLIGNHTMLHPHLAFVSSSRITQELRDCNAILEDITGQAIRFFRPPFGSRRPQVLRAARSLHLTPVMWNVTAHDWNPIGADRIFSNLEQGLTRNQSHHRGSNFLLHDGSHLALNASRLDSVTATDRLLTTHSSIARFVTVDRWI